VIHAAYLIPLFPLAGFLILAAFGKRLGNPLAGWLATAMVFGSFVVTVLVFTGLFERAPANRHFDQYWFTWFSAGSMHITAGALIDPLSMTMAAFVTGVSSLIHLYSIGYMEHDEAFPKFFTYLNLFVFAMLILVLADNFVLSFFGWEGVGVCSYFLIAFWFERPAAATAGKKAMIYNRIGDAGFLVALFLIFQQTHTENYLVFFSRVPHLSTPNLVAIALLLFVGAAGKSAQIPLFPWLADAMEGPTPVSALIHAATMVTAGVYLMVRINPVLHLAPDAAHVIAWVGVATAFMAATIGCAQTDIKKVLAYSTVSQLGYMFLAAGTGAYVAAIFLMVTHAFYKALLFLSAGSVIHAMDDEQDIKRMGALRKLMPITGVTFFIGWLSIAGVPPLSGFWAKSQVLEGAYAVSPALWAVGAATAVLTAYYMGREYILVFLGQRRWLEEHGAGVHSAAAHEPHPHDARFVMTFPLIVLSVCSVFAGFIDLPFHSTFDQLERWLDPVVGASLLVHSYSDGALWIFAVIESALAIGGVVVAFALWRNHVNRPKLEPRFLFMAWFLDAGLDRYVAVPSEAFSRFSSVVIDNKVIDGAVNGVATVVRVSGQGLRKIQTGYVRNYALGILTGLVALVAFILVRAGV
jgi:NADH-quinone oxidoreductase subunit L